jgi:hypothetical protein
MAKGMGIKTSVKSGNFRQTKQGAGMTEKGVKAYRKANPGSKLRLPLQKTNQQANVRLVVSRFAQECQA